MKLTKHPLNTYPDLIDEKREELKISLYNHGFDPEFPIVLFEKKIIDGWQRYNVASELGIEVVTKEFEGTKEDAWEYILKTNKRRNISVFQHTAIQLSNSLTENATKDFTNEKIAFKLGSNVNYVSMIKNIQITYPKVFPDIISGELNMTGVQNFLNSKAREAVAKKAHEEAIAKAEDVKNAKEEEDKKASELKKIDSAHDIIAFKAANAKEEEKEKAAEDLEKANAELAKAKSEFAAQERERLHKEAEATLAKAKAKLAKANVKSPGEIHHDKKADQKLKDAAKAAIAADKKIAIARQEEERNKVLEAAKHGRVLEQYEYLRKIPEGARVWGVDINIDVREAADKMGKKLKMVKATLDNATNLHVEPEWDVLITNSKIIFNQSYYESK